MDAHETLPIKHIGSTRIEVWRSTRGMSHTASVQQTRGDAETVRRLNSFWCYFLLIVGSVELTNRVKHKVIR